MLGKKLCGYIDATSLQRFLEDQIKGQIWRPTYQQYQLVYLFRNNSSALLSFVIRNRIETQRKLNYKLVNPMKMKSELCKQHTPVFIAFHYILSAMHIYI